MQKPNWKLNNSKRLLIKLGTDCNLGCPHCHQVQKNFKEHPELLNWIKKEGFQRITFSGGEPLMYFPIIKRYMEALGPGIHYRMMSNGTLLSKEIAEFFSNYDVTYAISYDGKCGGRDLSIPIQWGNLKYLKNGGSGLCTVFSTPEFNFRNFAKDIAEIIKQYNLSSWVDPDFFKVNWIHQTIDAPNSEFTKEIADKYIEQVSKQLDQACYCLVTNEISKNALQNLIFKWFFKPNFKHGVSCCNELLISVNLDGTIMKCPYGTEVIGTIDNPPKTKLLDSFIPEKCKLCDCWDICRCSCIASITDLDCYVNKIMIKKVRELVKKYDIEDTIKKIVKQ